MFSKNIIFAIQHIKNNYPIIFDNLKTIGFISSDNQDYLNNLQYVLNSSFNITLTGTYYDSCYYLFFRDGNYVFTIKKTNKFIGYENIIDLEIIISNLDNFDLSSKMFSDDEILLLKLLGA